MKNLFIITGLTWLCTTSASLIPKVKIIPSAPATGPSIANYISTPSGLDGPKLSSINATSYDWWYFDAVAPDLKSYISIVFYTSLASGFPFLPDNPNTTTVVGVYTAFPNGTTTSDTLSATEVVVSDTGAYGIYEGAGAAWLAPVGHAEYVVTINSPQTGIFGSFILNSRAPAHYPCGPEKAGQDMHVGPNVGWSNAVPDAVGDVNFVIHGSRLAFTGVAYHDKNWGDAPFASVVGSWYWGHGRLGGYSIVWFSFLTPAGDNHVSAYVAKGDKILTASCKSGSIKVRPTGANDEYPPKPGNPPPGGFAIEIEIDEHGKQTLQANVTLMTTVVDGETLYYRMLGGMKGRVGKHGPELTGPALYEQFAIV
ncbi:hypothetical protein F5884DRAFT_239232 [Xylogone sp. PMI_703]|nr:hypothetical protein F5884DRAFT_239232 [Xylogone sp. PMI_703]